MPEQRRRGWREGSGSRRSSVPRANELGCAHKDGTHNEEPAGVSWAPHRFGTRLFVLHPTRCQGQDAPPLFPQCTQCPVVARSWGCLSPWDTTPWSIPRGDPRPAGTTQGPGGGRLCPHPWSRTVLTPYPWGFFPPCPGAGRAWPRSPSALAAGQVTLIKV